MPELLRWFDNLHARETVQELVTIASKSIDLLSDSDTPLSVERLDHNRPNAAGSMPLSSRIIRSVIFGGLRYLLIAPIPFLMTPLILRKIGVAGYGTWAVFLAINGLTSLADLGLVGTSAKFVAEYSARRDSGAMDRLLNSALVLFLLLDFVIITALWAAMPLLAARLFRGSTTASSDLVFLLHCFSIVIAANILTQLFASITTGLHRLDLTNIVSTVNVLLSTLLGAFLLLTGWGLHGLVYASIVSAIVTIAMYIAIVRKLMPQFRVNCMRFDASEARKMLSYSLRLYVTQAAVIVHNQIEKVFLALLVGVPSVGWFEIASDLALKIRGAIVFILTPVLPAASGLNALTDEPRLRELYYRSHKYLAVWGVPVVCFVIAIADRFVVLWLGPSFGLVAIPLSALLAAHFLNLITGPGFFIFAGSGNLKPGIQSALAGLICNVVLSLGLIYRFGFPGAVLGTCISLILASAYFMLLFHRQTGYSILRVAGESYLKPMVCSVLILTVLVSIRAPRDLTWFGLALMGTIFGAAYTLAILSCRFFDDYDWSKIVSFMPLTRLLRRISPLA